MPHKFLTILYQNALNFREYRRDDRGRFAKSNNLKSADIPAKQTTLSHIHDREAIAAKIKDWESHHDKIRDILKATEIKQGIDKFSKDGDLAAKRGHKYLEIPKGIDLSDEQKNANKEHHDKNLNITVQPTEAGNFYRINNEKLGGFIKEKDGVHHVSLRHLYNTTKTIPFKSPELADKYLKDVIKGYAEERLIPIDKKDDVVAHNTKNLNELKKKNKSNIYKNANQKILDDNVWVGSTIANDLKGRTNNVGTVDDSGKLQAAAKYKNESNHIYVDYLATAPWNLTDSHENKVKGAAAKTLAHLARISVDRGHKGKLKLTALDKAKSFYDHLGFTENDNGDGKMSLSAEAAKKLIEKYGGK